MEEGTKKEEDTTGQESPARGLPASGDAGFNLIWIGATPGAGFETAWTCNALSRTL